MKGWKVQVPGKIVVTTPRNQKAKRKVKKMKKKNIYIYIHI